MPRTVPLWARALAATLIVQTASSFETFSIPLLGPLLTARAGLAPESIGYITAFSYAGLCWFLACGNAMLGRHGSVRTLQFGLVCSAIGLLVIAQPFALCAMAGALAVGFGSGPNTSAGSQLLMRTAPARHRSLIFSIKQAGVPFGGVVTGFALAPLAAAWGFATTLALIIVVALATALAVQPFRGTLDEDRDRGRQDWARSLLSWKEMTRSVASLRTHPSLPLLTALGTSYSVTQTCLTAFTATYIVTRCGTSLAEAGRIMAVMQVASMTGRILMGWTADRTGHAIGHLAIQAMASALAVCLLVASAAGSQTGAGSWSLYASAALVGFTAVGWNGVHMAELARVAPLHRVSDVTSAASLFGFIGAICGPLIFTVLVSWSGSYAAAFLLIAAQLALSGLVTLVSAVKSAGRHGPARKRHPS